MEGGRGLQLLAGRINTTIERAGHSAALAEHANALAGALPIEARHQGRLGQRQPDQALANAVPYMQAFGHVVIAWMWLEATGADRLKTQRIPPGRRRPPTISSITNCPGSTPGCAWWKAAT